MSTPGDNDLLLSKPANWDDVMALALKDPVVQACVTMFFRGDLTMEQAMCSCIVALSTRYARLAELHLRTIEVLPYAIRYR